MKHRRFLLSLFLLFLSFVTAHADAPSSTARRDAAVAEALRLIEVRRYVDALPQCGTIALIAPEDAAFYETRGALALHVGDVRQATEDFQAARVEAPLNDPLPTYGLGLCALLCRDVSGGRALLAESLANAPDVRHDRIAPAVACADLALGERKHALADLDGSQSDAARELSALIACDEHSSGTADLQAFVDGGRMNGVPRVVEPSGMRLMGAESIQEAVLSPSVTEAPLQAMYVRRFAAQDGNASSANAQCVTGQVKVEPQGAFGTGRLVSLSIDGHIVGVNNAPPYTFTWDTHEVGNGTHVLRFNAVDDAGTSVGNEERQVTVLNKDSSFRGLSRPLPPALQDRLWNLLTIQPSYGAAEWRLAQAAKMRGDRAQWASHLLTAAALDPEDHNAGAQTAPFFAGQVPARFPLPASFKRGSLGLSAGQVSDTGLWLGNPNVREVALTFDDGPLPGPANALLDALKESGASATFFVVGMRAAESPEVLRRMAAEGHEVEDHSYTHPNLDQALPEHVLQEILRTAVVIKSQTGQWPHFLRPPGGNTNAHVLATARACGMVGAFWTIDALSAEEGGSPDAVAKYVVSRAQNGAVVLMHNGMPATVQAVPRMAALLRARGFKLVTLRQLEKDALSPSAR